MELAVISLVALLASVLTLFSGFGLGTILMPAMALFFPLEAAIALTAVVHFANNFFKLVFLGRFARWDVVLKFGIPALAAAFWGAQVLFTLEGAAPIASYILGERSFEITAVKLSIAALIIIFLFLENAPWFAKLSFPPSWLPAGGIMSGFLGGLSGHQGALRSAFLLKCGLTKEAFIASGIVIACLVDLARLSVYTKNLQGHIRGNEMLLVFASAAAFCGVFLGSRLFKKVTLATVQKIVSILLFLIAMFLAAGLI